MSLQDDQLKVISW